MTSSDKNLPSIDLQLNANLQKLEELSGRFFEVLNNKKQINLGLNGPGHDLFVKTAGAYLKSMAQNPTFFMEQQISYWGKTLEYFAETQEQFFSNSADNENIEHVVTMGTCTAICTAIHRVGQSNIHHLEPREMILKGSMTS